MSELYQKILQGLQQYAEISTMLEDRYHIGRDEQFDAIIVAPWWTPERIFQLDTIEIETRQTEFPATWIIKNHGLKIAYIRTGIGAPIVGDCMLSLGLSCCNTIFFVGSVGALDASIPLGEMIIPKFSISGDGFCHYLDYSISSSSLFCQYAPSEELTKEMLHFATLQGQDVLRRIVYSTDTIAAQFLHLDQIIGLGAQAIEMETAVFSHCLSLIEKQGTALLVVSDNSLQNRSLISGRNSDDINQYHDSRKRIGALIVSFLLQQNRKNND